jgi:uncharacterized protein YbaA (DUF1428 family)
MITTTAVADGFVIVIDGDSKEKFQELVQRGANLWPDASAEIKEFADIITNGEVMQNYQNQVINKTGVTK